MTAAVEAKPESASVPLTSVASAGARAMLMGTPRPPSIWEAMRTEEVRRRSRGSSAGSTVAAGPAVPVPVPVPGVPLTPHTCVAGVGDGRARRGLVRQE